MARLHLAPFDDVIPPIAGSRPRDWDTARFEAACRTRCPACGRTPSATDSFRCVASCRPCAARWSFEREVRRPWNAVMRDRR